MNTPTISVIIPVYNTAPYLKRCIESILSQSYRNLQIILINDGSTDESPSICDQYAKIDSRVQVVHKQNEGVSAARNTGLDYASGDYISFVDSDDYIESNCYEVLMDKVIEEPCDIIVFDYYINYQSDEKLHKTPAEYLGNLERSETLDLFLHPINPFIYTKLYHKKLIESTRFCDQIHWGEDSIFAYEAMSKAQKITSIPDHLYHYVQSENSVTRSTSFNRKLITGLDFAHYFIQVCLEKSPNKLHLAYSKLAHMLATLTFNARVLKKNDTTKRYITIESRKLCSKLFFTSQISLKVKAKLILISYLPFLYNFLHRKSL